MTPDEHAAEAERILAGFREQVGADHLHLHAAQVHALLATRPAPLSMEEAAARVDAWRAAHPTPPAELTDGPTPPFTGGERMTWIPEQSPRRPTIIDYDRAMKNAMDALHEAMPHHIRITHTRLDVLPWAKAAIDAFADTPTTET